MIYDKDFSCVRFFPVRMFFSISKKNICAINKSLAKEVYTEIFFIKNIFRNIIVWVNFYRICSKCVCPIFSQTIVKKS